MGSTLTICLPDELAAAIERISEDEQIDTSVVVRRLIERAVDEYRHEQAFERY
jgi:metal-responsive CopG/Arc/MetJ family transcriptional regulator